MLQIIMLITFCLLAIPLVLMGLSIANWLLATAFGGAPVLQWASYLRHLGKRLRGLSEVSEEVVCRHGYLYHEVKYSNGSTLLFRE